MNKEQAVDKFLDEVKEFMEEKAEEMNLELACLSVVGAITIGKNEVAAVHTATKSIQEFWEEGSVGDNLAMYDAAQQMFRGYKAIALQIITGIIGKKADEFSSEERDEILRILKSMKTSTDSHGLSEGYNEINESPRDGIFSMLQALKNS